MHSSRKRVLPFAILPLTILACAARCHAVPRGSFAISFANSLRSCLLTSPSGHIRHEPLVSFSRGGSAPFGLHRRRSYQELGWLSD
jgi:hypothetical protein